MKHRLAARLVAKGPPGGEAGARFPEADGRTLAVLSRGDTLDVYFAGRTKAVVTFSCSPRTALRLAWWVLWTWWVRATWCGLRLRLWRWAVRTRQTTAHAPRR